MNNTQCYLVTFKAGLGKPVMVYATDYAAAQKEGLALFKKNYGDVETVDFYSTVDNTIAAVELIGE